MPVLACCSLQSLRQPLRAAAEEAAVVDTPTPSPPCTVVTPTTPRRPRQPFRSLSTSLRTCHAQREGPERTSFPVGAAFRGGPIFFVLLTLPPKRVPSPFPAPYSCPPAAPPAFYLHSLP